MYDLGAVGLLALVLLFPEPGVTVRPALPRAGAHEIDRIAELEAKLSSHPDDVDSALELSDLYVVHWRPDWALATLGPLAARYPDDFRIPFGMAVAFADRFDFPRAKQAIADARAACTRAATRGQCGDPDQVRMSVFEQAVGDVVAQGVNPAWDPNKAREIIDRVLHNARVPAPRRK
jgi:hypothetical protein